MEQKGDRQFLEGVDPESIKDVEKSFQNTLSAETERVAAGKGDKQFLEGIDPRSIKDVEESSRNTLREQRDLSYQQTPEYYKAYVTSLFNDVYEKMSKEYPELADCNHARRTLFIKDVVLRSVGGRVESKDNLQDGRQLSEEELDVFEPKIRSSIEACLRKEAEEINAINFLRWKTEPASGGEPKTRLGKFKNALRHRKGGVD